MNFASILHLWKKLGPKYWRVFRSHCSFRPLHLLSPFPSTHAHSFQPKTNSSPPWPTSLSPSHLLQMPPQLHSYLPITSSFFLIFLHHPTCPSLPLSSPMLPATLPPATNPLFSPFSPLPSPLNPFNPPTLHLLL